MKGHYGKYIISKTDGSKVDPNADYFVLRLDKDPRARKAVLEYAKSIRLEDPKLYEDLLIRCMAYENERSVLDRYWDNWDK